MRRTAYIVLGGSLGLTFVFLLLWILGFFFVSAIVGSLIHLLVVFAMFSSMGVVVGIVLLIVSHIRN